MMLAGMVARGLGTRNTSDAFADAMKDSYVRMFTRYPPDIVSAVCNKLWGNWLPSRDIMEADIIDLVTWRQRVMNALENAEILSEEKIEYEKMRAYGYELCAALEPFPFWDTGLDSTRERWSTAKDRLKVALNEYEANVRPQISEYDRQVSEAHEFIAAPFIPYPYGAPTAEEREAARERDKKALAAYQAEMSAKLLSEDAAE